MTIIAAIHDPIEECTWIASDTLALFECLRVMQGPKWVRGKAFAVGYAGDARSGDLLRAAPEAFWRAREPWSVSLDIRAMLHDDGYERVNDASDNPPINYGQEFLYADARQVCIFDTQFGLTPMPAGVFGAIGSGALMAFGAAFALPTVEPETRLRTAVEAAMALDRNSGGELWLDKIDG